MTPKGGVVPHTRFRIPAKKSEVLFTDYIAEHLTPDGRGGVIVPNGIVATTQNAYVKLRRFLVEDSLVAVVSLPAGVFKPYSGVKTSILLLDKKLARQTDKILFLKIVADGFDLGDKRTPIEANDLPEAERVVRAWLCGEIGSTEGATSSQPGATPQETNSATTRGLKARAIAASDESGLQPSANSSDLKPGAVPQAGMARVVGAPLAWKLVEKRELLADKSASLSAERYTDESAVSAEIETVRLGDVCEKCQQANPTTLGRPSFRYIDIDSVDNERLCITDRKALPVGEAPSRARKLVRTGDVLFSTVRPYLRNVATVPAALDGEIASTGFGVIRADASRVLPGYLFAVVSDQRFVDNANALTNGASYPAITENQLFDIEIPLPPLEEQRRIVAELDAEAARIEAVRGLIPAFESKIQRVLARV